MYKCELYDCAECINLCLLLRDRFPQLETVLHNVVGRIAGDWIKPDGSFRSRRLLFGWDNVPMHRWSQAQMFRSLTCFLAAAARETPPRPGTLSARDSGAPCPDGYCFSLLTPRGRE